MLKKIEKNKFMNNIIKILMIATILSFFGCNGQNKKKSKTKFTEETIDKISDENLLLEVYDNISLKLPKDYKKEYESVIKLSKSEQAIYMIWGLEAEINNGGFNQYFFNSSGQFAELTPDALKLVGAVKFAELTEKANRIYKTENDKITKHQDGTIDGFSKSYDENPLNELDDEFYALYDKEKLHDLQIEYIRKNKKDFIEK
jgi:hypothetical protein